MPQLHECGKEVRVARIEGRGRRLTLALRVQILEDALDESRVAEFGREISNQQGPHGDSRQSDPNRGDEFLLLAHASFSSKN